MPTTRRRPGHAAPLALLLALLIAFVGLTGCSDDDGGPADGAASPGAPSSGPTSREQSRVEGVPVPPDLARTFTRLLERRADAVLRGDREAFAAVLGPDPDFRTMQLGYYDNLAALPLETLSYDLDRASLVRDGRSYWVVVDVALQLSGFDAAAVHSPDRFRFTRGRGGGYRLTSVTDTAWEREHRIENQPWDIEPISVLQGAGVLGIFDAGSEFDATALVRAVGRAVSDVRAVVPYADWNGDVVFYALSSPDFLAGLPRVPGGDPATLDGLTFTLPVSADDASVAATRVVLGPSVISAPPLQRDRLIRHELTHVATAAHDDHAPLWLSEGLAEYVSVWPLPADRRTVDRGALDAAEHGRLQRLPDDDRFHDAGEADVDYALSWWVCEWIAKTYGDYALWSLLDHFDRAGMDTATEIRRVLRLGEGRLVRNAAMLMVDTYRPQPTTSPTTSPTSPATGSPSATALPGG